MFFIIFVLFYQPTFLLFIPDRLSYGRRYKR